MDYDILNSLLIKYFGFPSLRDKQKEIIDLIVNNKNSDILAILPTSGGKSLIYQILSLMSEKCNIVVCPLKSLMLDQTTKLKNINYPVGFINGDVKNEELLDTLEGIRTHKIKLLYVTPESLLKLYENINPEDIEYFFLDETHCVSVMGQGFRPSYKKISTLRTHFSNSRMIGLSATISKVCQKDVLDIMKFNDPKIYFSSIYRKNLNIKIIKKKSEDDFKIRLINLLYKYEGKSGIIYCTSRKSTESISKMLKQNGIKSDFYHGSLPTEKREAVQNDWLNKKTQVICCTISFGLGVDGKDTYFVIHSDMPSSIEGYVQEIGRCQRDISKTGEVTMFYSL